MVNHMEEVAKMLGVEFGEKFKIVFADGNTGIYDYYLNEKGICVVGFGQSDRLDLLYNLILGTASIKRIHWKPNDQDVCWSVLPDNNITGWPWNGGTDDMNYYKLGNCYRTKAEAESNRDKWMAFYASDEVLEV